MHKIIFTLSFLFFTLWMDDAVAKDRVIYDMTGSPVVVPKKIDKVITIGAVPVISSFIFAIDKGLVIKNALPKTFTKVMTNKLYYTLATNASKTAPYTINDASVGVNIESILQEKPQLVLTMDPTVAQLLRSKGLNTACLLWRNEQDAKHLMTFLGEVLDAKKKALEYNGYADRKLDYVLSRIATIPAFEKQKVVYMDYKTMSNPHLIADWWIAQAGGISVTEQGRKTEKHSFSSEQLLVWNPDIIVLSNPNDVDEIYKNKALSNISAIKHRRVLASPSGMHLWANRTSEQPLMILWAAKQFYPKYFSDLDIKKETIFFYSHFLNYRLSEQDAKAILEPISIEKGK